MLSKMGWKEDKGLGKNETGMITSIKAKRREEGQGLGVEKTQVKIVNNGTHFYFSV